MTVERTELLRRGKLLLFLCIISLTLTTPYQETMNTDCDVDCFSTIQSAKAFVSFGLAAILGLICDVIPPEQLIIIVASINIFVHSMAIGRTDSKMIMVLSIFTASSSNLCYVLVRVFFARSLRYSDDTEKAHVFGQLGSTQGLSSIVGPLLGSYVLSSFQDTLYVACTLLCVNVCAVQQLCRVNNIRQDVTPEHQLQLQSSKSTRKPLSSPPVLVLLALKFLMAMAYGLFLPLHRTLLLHRLELPPQTYSLYLISTAIAVTLCQHYLSSRVAWLAGSNQDYVLVVCGVLLSLCRVAMVTWTHSLLLHASLVVVLAIALVTANTLLSVACSNVIHSKHIGGVLGWLDFTENFAGILSPLAGAELMKSSDSHTLAGVCMVYFCFNALVIRYFREYFSITMHTAEKDRAAEDSQSAPTKPISSRVKKRAKSPTSVAAAPVLIKQQSACIALRSKKCKLLKGNI